MATASELSEQLSLTQKLAGVVEQMAKTLARIDSSYDTQISSVEKLTKAFEALRSQDLSGLNRTKLDGLQKEFKSASKDVVGLTGKLKDLGTNMSKKFPTALAVAGAALSGLVQGIRNVIALSKGVAGFAFSFVKGVGSITASILSIPFKIFNSLVDMAAAAGGGSNELAEAIENLRKEMGDLAGPGASAVLDTAAALQGFSDTGLTAFQVFGTLAERLKEVTKVAVAMGSTFSILKEEFRSNGGALLAFQKGLGVSDEGMKAIGDSAIAMGRPMSKVFLDMTKQTIALGKAFDLDQKLIGKDMVKAFMDVRHFGSLTVKEMAQASVYARKLGLELDKIVGVMDAFDTFDTAAENAAKLSQAFGVNVDAFKLMEAQSPAEKMDMLRKSFRDAGVDASKFTNAQRKLAAQALGLDEAVVKQAFSTENYGASLDDVKKKSESAADKAMDQAGAMRALAASIERLVKSGGGGQEGGFWQQFVKGFLGGLQSSKEFMSIIINIKRSLHLTYMEGVRLGKAFVTYFPGVKQFLGGIADFFNPTKFKALVGGVTDVIIQWMKDLNDPHGKASFSSLMDKLREKFFNFFDAQTSSGKKMLDGFKSILKTITTALGEGMKWAADRVGEGLTFIIDLLTGKKKLTGVKGAAKEGMGFLGELILPLADGMVHAWKVIAPKMWELVKLLAKKLFDYLSSEEFIGIIKPAIPVVAAALFGPVFSRAILGALTASLAKGAMSALSAGGSKLMELVTSKISSIASSAKAPTISDKLPQASDTQKVTEAGQAMSKGDKGVSWSSVLKFLVAVAGVIAIGMAALFVSIAIIRAMKVQPMELVEALVAIAVVSLAMLPVAGALALISKVKLDAKSTSVGILAIGLSLVAMGGVIWLTYQILKGLDADKLKNVADVMMQMSKVFIMAAAIIGIAAGIGAAILSSVGIAAAIIATGMTALIAAIAVMAEAVIVILKKINSIPMSEGFFEKVKAFTAVMDSVTNFAKNLTSMLDAMKPSLISLIKGKDDTVERIKQLRVMLDSFVGAPGAGGMIGLVEKIVWAVQQMANGDTKVLTAAKAFTEIMSAMTGIASAMKPPDKFFESIDGTWTTSGDVLKGIDKLTAHADKVTTGIIKLVDVVVDKIIPIINGTNGRGMSEEQVRAATAFGELFSAVVKIGDALSPKPEVLAAMQSTYDDLLSSGRYVSPEHMEKLARIIATTAEGIQKIIQSTVDSLAPIITAIGQWHFSANDAQTMKAVGPLLQQMFAMISNIVIQTSSVAAVDVNKVKAAGEFLDKLGTVMPTFFAGIAESLPAMFESLKKGLMSLTSSVDAKRLEEGLKSFTAVMNVTSEILKVIGDVDKTAAYTGSEVGVKGFKLAKGFTEISKFFEYITSSVMGSSDEDIYSGKGMSPLARLAKALSDPSFKTSAEIKSNVETVKTMFGAINEVMNVVKAIQGIDVGNLTGVGAAGYTMALGIKEVVMFFRFILNGSEAGSLKGEKLLPDLIEMLQSKTIKSVGSMKNEVAAVKDMFSAISEIVKASNVSIGSFENGQALLTTISNVTDLLNDLAGFRVVGEPVLPQLATAASGMKKYAKALMADGIVQALEAVSEIVATTQKLDDALASLPKIGPVNAKLESVAKAAGLGGKAVYTVRSKEIVINMHVNVTMDVGEAEKVMITRANSSIRQRLDFLADEANAGPLIMPGASYVPSSGAPPALTGGSGDAE